MTKRGILSQLASLYDPLGLIGPFILPAKHVLQVLSRKGFGWDEPVEGSELESWNCWKKVMLELEGLHIPRWYQKGCFSSRIQLHLFCDASEKGYGAVAYLRYVGERSSHCSIVTAKSRVAPLKQTTIPRLELSAGVVAADIYRMLKHELELEIEATYFWTDSKIVLHYLRNETSRFETFVANRVARILDVTQASQWGHVGGNENPADLASRGMTFEDKDVNLWFNGPPFLKGANRLIQQEPCFNVVPESELSMKTSARVNLTVGESTGCVFTRFSSWTKLVKCIVWLTRFKGNRVNSSVKMGPIKVDELRAASDDIVKMVQLEGFPMEVKML
ncbi:hypothetical protein, partial [Streptococcus dysgalactiae]|uniref:hypothetical protein n=1 Tax=Streptococcus dysgalactiae TaxID=1334 RepID=UPI00194F715A